MTMFWGNSHYMESYNQANFPNLSFGISLEALYISRRMFPCQKSHDDTEVVVKEIIN